MATQEVVFPTIGNAVQQVGFIHIEVAIAPQSLEVLQPNRHFSAHIVELIHRYSVDSFHVVAKGTILLQSTTYRFAFEADTVARFGFEDSLFS